MKNDDYFGDDILEQMYIIRELCREGHRMRQKYKIPLRQPIQSVTFSEKYILELKEQYRNKIKL